MFSKRTFCRMKTFYKTDVLILRVLNDLFVSPKYFWPQTPHGTRYTAPWPSKGWTGSFPFRSLSPIIRMGFKNDVMLWSYKHLCSLSDKPLQYGGTIGDRLYHVLSVGRTLWANSQFGRITIVLGWLLNAFRLFLVVGLIRCQTFGST